MNTLSKILLLTLLLSFGNAASGADTGSITLAWDANPENNIAGYRIHYGTSSGSYPSTVEVGNNTIGQVSNLPGDMTYYFVVTAYNTEDLESPNSAQVSAFVPPANSTPTPTPTATPAPTATPTATPPPSGTPTATPSPSPTATPKGKDNGKGKGKGLDKDLVNVSTRVGVQQDDGVMIGGFIVSGDSDKSVLLRAIGPSLTAFGVKGALADPMLEIYDSAGNLIAQNDNWTSLAPGTVPAEYAPGDANEAAVSMTVSPGSYTAVVRGVGNTTGIALCELYDLDSESASVTNVSTRGHVGTGDDVLIGGFVIGGEETTQVLIRAVGPSLTNYGVTGALADPNIELHSADGTLIYGNDDWHSDQEQDLIASGIAPSDEREAAIIATLSPGTYTAIVRGKGNNTGVALVEVYNLENP